MSGVRSSGTGLTCGGYTISSQVLTSTGRPLFGVSIKTTRGLMNVSDASGNYTLSNIPDGSYTLYAEKSGYAFCPVALDVSLGGASLNNQNFAGTAFISYQSPTPGPSPTPTSTPFPGYNWIISNPGSGNFADGEVISNLPSSLKVQFTNDVLNDGTINSVTGPNNYLLSRQAIMALLTPPLPLLPSAPCLARKPPPVTISSSRSPRLSTIPLHTWL